MATTTETYVRNQLYFVNLAELQPDPAQPRKYLDPSALEELTASVTQHGILEPILFRQDEKTKLLYCVAGERRCAAARKAGLVSVPAVFIDSKNFAEIALVENLLRQDLNPVEESEALQRLQDDHAYKQEDLARIIGRSVTTISESLSLSRLPKEIRDECRQDPTVPKNILITIARSKQQRGMFSQYRKYRQAQAKAAEEITKTKTKRTPAEAMIAAMESTEQKITTLDLTTLTQSDLASVLDTMRNLKGLLEKTLAAAPKPKQNLA